jgi:hypothetical protein
MHKDKKIKIKQKKDKKKLTFSGSFLGSARVRLGALRERAPGASGALAVA